MMIIISDNQWELLNILAKTHLLSIFLKEEKYPESIINAPNRWDALESARIINMDWYKEMFDSLSPSERVDYEIWISNNINN